MPKERKHIADFDWMRVMASFAVVLLHVSAQYFNVLDTTSFGWGVSNFYDSMVRWSVPVFVMISGALFLDPNRPVQIRNLYCKNITKLAVLFVFWSMGYAILHAAIGKLDEIDILRTLLVGHYHLWYLPMLIGLYMIVPFLREIVRSRHLMRYFLLLSIIFAMLVPQLMKLPGRAASLLMEAWGNMAFHFTLGYTGYFIGGYYLSRIDASSIHKGWMVLLGLMGWGITMSGTYFASRFQGIAVEGFYDNLSPWVAMESVAVFLLIRTLCSGRIAANIGRFVHKLAGHTLGIYLVHPAVISLFTKLNIDSQMFNPLFAVPLVALGVFVVSAGVINGIRRIPFLNRWIV